MQRVGRVSSEAEYYYCRAINAESKEQPKSVLEYFDRAIAAHPGYAMAWSEKGNFLESIGKIEDALLCFDMALKLDPESSEVWFNRGMTLRKVGRDNEAKDSIIKGIDLACDSKERKP